MRSESDYVPVGSSGRRDKAATENRTGSKERCSVRDGPIERRGFQAMGTGGRDDVRIEKEGVSVSGIIKGDMSFDVRCFEITRG